MLQRCGYPLKHEKNNSKIKREIVIPWIVAPQDFQAAISQIWWPFFYIFGFSKIGFNLSCCHYVQRFWGKFKSHTGQNRIGFRP
jgi:hypothetical protein